MNENKEIEEMAKEIQKSVDGCANYWAKLIATHLYEQGYRNYKDKVVLDKEEYKKFLKVNSELAVLKKSIPTIKAEARKETAREIIEMLVPPCEVCDENWHKGCLCLRATIAEKIAKKYNVEVNSEENQN